MSPPPPSSRDGGPSAGEPAGSDGLGIRRTVEYAVVLGVVALLLGVLGSMGIAGIEMLGWKLAGVRITGVSHWPWNTPGALLGLFVGFEAIGLRYVRSSRDHAD